MTKQVHQNPNGGLSEAGRKYYKKKEGANLKPPVKSADGPAELRRRGSFLVRMGSANGPLTDEKGEPTRLKKSLVAWGHSGDKATAVAKGRRILDRYKKSKDNTA